MVAGYQVVPGDAFEARLAVVTHATMIAGDAARHEQVNQLELELDGLGREPRNRRHWSKRILVYKDSEGRVLQNEQVPDDMELDENDLEIVQYVVESPLHVEGAGPKRLWGGLVTFYSVNDDDAKVVLIGIHLILV